MPKMRILKSSDFEVILEINDGKVVFIYLFSLDKLIATHMSCGEWEYLCKTTDKLNRTQEKHFQNFKLNYPLDEVLVSGEALARI